MDAATAEGALGNGQLGVPGNIRGGVVALPLKGVPDSNAIPSAAAAVAAAMTPPPLAEGLPIEHPEAARVEATAAACCASMTAAGTKRRMREEVF